MAIKYSFVALILLAAPHFFLKPDAISPKMAEMAATIKAADCYVIVSAEYNHTAPPALLSLLGHFGGSNVMNLFFI